MKPRRGRSGIGPWLGILVPLALGFVMSVALAWQTWDASRVHRATAEATVRDHAAFAAHLLAARIDRRMGQAMLYAFYRVDLAVRVDSVRWPPAEALRVDQEIERCAARTPAERRVYFRWVGGRLDVVGAAPAGFRPWLEGWVPDVAARPAGARPWGLRFGAPGLGPEGVAYRTYRFPEGTAVYGLDNCLRDLEGDVVAAAAEGSGLFPPTLVPETDQDSLFRYALLDASGGAVRGEVGEAAFRGRAPVLPRDAYGGLEVEVRLDDDAGRRLMIGGLPRSRLPEAIALVLLTGLLLAIAAAQLRRGQELVRLRERFVANASHELRTPLQQILLFSDLLRLDRLSDATERRRALEVIHRETRRLMGLVENLLVFSRASRGEAGGLNVRDTALLPLVRAVAESFEPIAAEREATLEVDGDEVAVRADPEAVTRVLVNVLDNAVKYGPAGQTVRVRVQASPDEGTVSIEDEGPGIPEAERGRVWDPHVRLEREEDRGSSGQGIGLALVRDLIERMDGRAEIGTSAAGGARFSLHLPRSAA